MIIATVGSSKFIIEDINDAETLLRIMEKSQFVRDSYVSKKGETEKDFVLHYSANEEASIAIVGKAVLDFDAFNEGYDS